MKGTDWLTFLGPIILGLLALVTPYVKSKLEQRDERARIRADLALYDLLPPMVGKDALATSIDRRVRILATSSMPRAWRFEPDRRGVRFAFTAVIWSSAALALWLYASFWWIADTREQKITAAVMFAVASVVLTGSRIARDRLDVMVTRELHDEEMARSQEEIRKQKLEGERLVQQLRDSIDELERRTKALPRRKWRLRKRIRTAIQEYRDIVPPSA